MMVPLCNRCFKTLYKRSISTGIGYSENGNYKWLFMANRIVRHLEISNYIAHRRYSSVLDGKPKPKRSNLLTFKRIDSDDACNDYDDNDDSEYMYPLTVKDLIMESNTHNTNLKLMLKRKSVTETQEEKLDVESYVRPKCNIDDWLSRNREFATSIQGCLRERLHPNCTVEFFGSAINGLWTDNSDLDICLKIPNVTSRSAIIRNLRRASVLLEPLSPNRVFEHRFSAKIPILHWRESRRKNTIESTDPMDTSPFKISAPSIDISINNTLALANSALVGSYVNYDERLRSLILCLKQWARSRDINDRSKGTFGSFALSIMAIHLLQRCDPPILPSLQDLALSTNETPTFVEGVDCRFTKDKEKIDREMELLRSGSPPNNAGVMELLLQFFEYFGWLHQRLPEWPICIRSVDPSIFKSNANNKDPEFFKDTQGNTSLEKKRHGTTIDVDERFMHVDNPFEMGVDVANIAIHQRSRITTELRRAYRILKAGHPFSSILGSEI
ncbi:bifunctional Nucleotidyltransferase superfamily/TUTase nucleotidyltransferase domain [Babesia duncani]|uniref:Bifunctional Nucleotidyltransferase superfamily/TUTase nucleotidyltransferase domain n=1 Tax=Babesia duncani TaxID=323732 RepID=A0AAD9UMJ2_9APIC|nr:bifunctional Nucleotidyltransferase superfamily/TUTase nucleotidyltransferase domain [Babesia duncani]KAK2198132.1 bifunctional Nucleotidyltransferase superfamily/TUTase nucleotidyltransferase domain [Babesia duncani]